MYIKNESLDQLEHALRQGDMLQKRTCLEARGAELLCRLGYSLHVCVACTCLQQNRKEVSTCSVIDPNKDLTSTVYCAVDEACTAPDRNLID